MIEQFVVVKLHLMSFINVNKPNLLKVFVTSNQIMMQSS